MARARNFAWMAILCWPALLSAQEPAGAPAVDAPVVESEAGIGSLSTTISEIAAPATSNALCESCSGFDFSKVPPVRPLPRLGMPILFPNGPGYYSLMDQLEGNYREKAPNLPFGLFAFTPGSSFDVDFRYLDKPDNTQHDFLDPLKRIRLGDDWLVSFGGQTWVRTMNEVSARLTNADNSYQLLRNREHMDLWYRDRFRVYAEYIYADSFNQDLNPLPIDINRSDMLNLFTDLKILDGDGSNGYLRIGRQELLYGSQRLISPLEWANTRRTFQGVKAFYTGKEWNLDAFWVQPVAINRNDFDSVNNNQNFLGAWATRKFEKGSSADFYYLYLDNTTPTPTAPGGQIGGNYVHTMGTRYFGKFEQWMVDVELMFQLGNFANQDKIAGSAPVGLGYEFANSSWKPQLWLYYDWASGDKNPGMGSTNTTFTQLFPFGHYYFGYLDQVGRQNIQDVYTQLTFFPQNWLTCLVQLHNFWLANPHDALYNAAGIPIRRDATGQSGSYVGTEIDLLATAQVTTHLNLAIGWSKLFAGDFITNTGPDVSPELLYIQANYRW